MFIQQRTDAQPAVVEPKPATVAKAGYLVRISDEIEEPAWDAFVEQIEGGHHVQTSLWAQVKASLGWRAARVIVSQGGQIVAGAQMLIRAWPMVGAVGYVSKGPVLAYPDPALEEVVITALQQMAQVQRVQHLTVQPPNNGEYLTAQLTSRGFRSGGTDVAPTATVLLDLSQDLETLLAQVDRKTRYNIRLGQRRGVTVREGGAEDLAAYYQILQSTGQRQNFTPYPIRYFTELWRIFNPRGYARLFLAEFEGELVSAQLTIPFGTTVTNKLSVWSGAHGHHRPNEVLQWAVIEWAKTRGYRHYDFEGIRPEAARAILRHEPLPDSLQQTVTSFKLGFNGQVVLFPGAYEYVYNPLFRWAYTEVFPRVKKQRTVKRALKRLRTQ